MKSFMICLIKKYRELSLPAKASAWYIVCSLVQKGIAFLTMPIFTRIISREEFGEIILYGSWIEIMTILTTLQLSSGVFNKAMIKYANDRDGYTSSSLILATLITFFFFALYALGYQIWDKLFDLPHIMLLLMFVDILFTTPMAFYLIKNRFEYKYKQVVVLTLVIALIGPMASIIAVLVSTQNFQAEAKVIGLILVKVITCGWAFIKIIHKGKTLINVSYWKYALLYNLPLIPHYLSQQVLTQSDRVMINNICGREDAAIYGVAYQLSMAIFIFTYAIHSSFTPWMFERMRDGQYDRIRKKIILLEIYIGLLCVYFSLFAPELVMLMGGEAYMGAVWIIPPVAMSVMFQTIYTFFGNVEFYFEKTKFVMAASIICALMNLTLNYIFIPLYGFVAAGYTTLICYILYAFIHYVFCKNVLNENNIKGMFDGKRIWIIGMLLSAITFVVTCLYCYFIARYMVIIFTSLFVLFLGMKKKNMLTNINLIKRR